MSSIISTANCGNSPKMAFLREFNIAFAERNIQFLSESVTEDVVWNIIGEKTIEGKAQFVEALENMREMETSELLIEQILSHGKEGATKGIITVKNRGKYAFSDFYQFQKATGNKLKSISTFLIKIV